MPATSQWISQGHSIGSSAHVKRLQAGMHCDITMKLKEAPPGIQAQEVAQLAIGAQGQPAGCPPEGG